MKTAHRMIALALVLALLAGSLPAAQATVSISDDLQAIIDATPAGERIAVNIWLRNLSSDFIRQCTLQALGWDSDPVGAAEENEYSAKYKELEPQLYEAYQQDFFRRTVPDLPEDCFRSINNKYSPTSVVLDLTAEEIQAVARDECVTVLRNHFPAYRPPAGLPMDSALEKQMLQDFADFLNEPEHHPTYQGPDHHFDPMELYVMGYYGSYHGVEVAQLFGWEWGSTANMPIVKIAGLPFQFNMGAYAKYFFAYHDGTFTLVSDAYEQGLLTNSDLWDLYCAYTRLPAWENPYTDVAESDWFYEAACATSKRGWINGTSDSSFTPNGTMTRAMLVTILWRMYADAHLTYGNSFADVPSRGWYSAAVGWAAHEGIVNGLGDGTFAPNAPVTRQQLAAILYRLAGSPEAAPLSGDYADRSALSDWAEPAMSWAIEQGIVQGVQRGTEPGRTATFLSPTASATRAQAATMILRYYNCSEPIVAARTTSLMANYTPQNTDSYALTDSSADAIADFSLDLLGNTINRKTNAVLSPLSILNALAMVERGAAGTTRTQIEQATGLSTQELSEALCAINAGLNEKAVHLANSIWVRNGVPVKSEFLQDNADYLDAAAFQAPFDSSTINDINAWVSDQTDGLITDLISSLPADAALVLINTLLCKTQWVHPYDDPVDGLFYRTNGAVQNAQMLSSSEHIYLHDDYATGFRKQLMNGYDFAVIVPNEDVRLTDYLDTLDGAHLRELLEGEYYDLVMTQMPKFQTEISYKLPSMLKQLGITDAFSPQTADFSDMADIPIYLSEAIHKVKMDVNENGVSAAAATAFTGVGALEPEKVATVVADRPFLYLIIDQETNLPLFLGVLQSIPN